MQTADCNIKAGLAAFGVVDVVAVLGFDDREGKLVVGRGDGAAFPRGLALLCLLDSSPCTRYLILLVLYLVWTRILYQQLRRSEFSFLVSFSEPNFTKYRLLIFLSEEQI